MDGFEKWSELAKELVQATLKFQGKLHFFPPNVAPFQDQKKAVKDIGMN
ncbi:hypothetical protein COLO4_08550 [Corchorus olitorius]|uniref:Uncharacterized protein n=1 Tax=Corchorus olitorius TaxID=93759 RepID=A0A1R3KFJ5_9ROSI|nr:hypothetical protein COLO4_08550 [Corchorus olitorius]